MNCLQNFFCSCTVLQLSSDVHTHTHLLMFYIRHYIIHLSVPIFTLCCQSISLSKLGVVIEWYVARELIRQN
jgi:hypothetical protein